MSAPILAVKFFRTEVGNEPVREFLRELYPEERKIMGIDLKEVQYGWPLGMPLVRKMEKDLWEVRSRLPNKIVRVLFTVVAGNMVLLHVFIKKSEKTPKSDLETARQRLRQLSGGRNE